ncbi:MAG: MBOAT family protein [Ignavibacteriae bacterium]|nr:MBOAT family protein [Ignavibacteriota bacterium]
MIVGIEFYTLLATGAVIYWLIPKQIIRNYFLSAASIAFISYFDKYSAIIAVILILYSYMFAVLIEKNKGKRIFHRLGITGLVILLVIFKYLGFLNEVLSSLDNFISSLPVFKIEFVLLPLGISYIIFKHISYLTDVYWGINNKGRFADFLLYSSLFTIYIAGPIERFSRFKIESGRENKFSGVFIEESFKRIVFGLFKKFVVADWLGFFIAPVWENPGNYPAGIKILALFGYSIQIYLDFSAYSDIAIGASRLYGFKIMENFDYPYLKSNIAQFWRSWHISLSDWIRDYLFFPLSPVFKNKTWQIFFVPLIAMGLCGLWHGPAMHFVYWGLCHGFAIFIYQVWVIIKRKNPALNQMSGTKWFNAAGTLFTFVYVSFCWIFFR